LEQKIVGSYIKFLSFAEFLSKLYVRYFLGRMSLRASILDKFGLDG